MAGGPLRARTIERLGWVGVRSGPAARPVILSATRITPTLSDPHPIAVIARKTD
jgi:hypothetical protein